MSESGTGRIVVSPDALVATAQSNSNPNGANRWASLVSISPEGLDFRTGMTELPRDSPRLERPKNNFSKEKRRVKRTSWIHGSTGQMRLALTDAANCEMETDPPV
jgi:hypothetical protein